MPNLTQASIQRCSNIALAIDEELSKPFNERKSIYVRASNPRTLKGELATYKTQYKQEWKGQFWMLIHDSRIRNCRDHPTYGTCLEFSFTDHSRKVQNYEIVRPTEQAYEIYKDDVGEIGKSSFVLTEASDLNDTNAAIYILTESPYNMKLHLANLSKEVTEWFGDMKQDPPAFIKTLQKRGYFFGIRGQFLWITQEADSSLNHFTN